MEMGIEDKIKIVGLAKRLEEIIIPGDPTPLFLDKNSSSLKVLMHIRDEAHRFGITHHRNRRSKSQIVSELSQIKGIGPVTEEKLLRHFKSVARIKQATKDSLAAVIGSKGADIIISHFNKET